MCYFQIHKYLHTSVLNTFLCSMCTVLLRSIVNRDITLLRVRLQATLYTDRMLTIIYHRIISFSDTKLSRLQLGIIVIIITNSYITNSILHNILVYMKIIFKEDSSQPIFYEYALGLLDFHIYFFGYSNKKLGQIKFKNCTSKIRELKFYLPLQNFTYYRAYI